MNKPEYIIIHHSATDEGDVNAFRAYHKSLGWRDVGYHWVIPKSGELQKGRPEDWEGAHTTEQGMNRRSIGVCLTGNFDNYLPNEAQMKTLIALLKDIMKRYGIPAERIKLHRQYALNAEGKPYKSCPGWKFPFEEVVSKAKEA